MERRALSLSNPIPGPFSCRLKGQITQNLWRDRIYLDMTLLDTNDDSSA